jgi:hypothetical protein
LVAETAGEGPRATTPLAAQSSEFAEFGIEKVDSFLSTQSAGDHPDFTTSFVLNHHTAAGQQVTSARLQSVSVSLPPGLLGNVLVTPRCSTGEFAAYANCPVDSQVGLSKVRLSGNPIGAETTEPLYNLEPPHPDREIARFGFYAGIAPVFIDVRVRTGSDYGVTATVHGAPAQAAVLSAVTTLWGNPADPSHDELRLTVEEAILCPSGTACKAPGGKRSSGLDPAAFLTNPSACQAMAVEFSVESYQLPGQVFSASAPMDSIVDCSDLPFAPTFEAAPTSRVAGAATGLEATLSLPQQSLEAVGSPATATMREARVTLPEGMQIAAGAANWIDTCSEEQVGFRREVDAGCPDGSKLGTATVVSPLLPTPLQGAIYQRSPRLGQQLGLWLVSDELGLHVKIPGELEPDPGSGRLTAVFRDLPQVPVSGLSLHIWGGSRAPLENPASCGAYATEYAFAPHSQDPAVSGQSWMTVDAGCDRPFSPTLRAGVTRPVAGRFSPLVIDLARPDGQRALRGFTLTLPDGLLAKLRGVPLCPEAQAAAGVCPPESRIGRLTAAVGPGPDPLWVPQPGKPEPAIYLAGPYRAAPFSVITVVPAQAGPFDLGDVVVRTGLSVDARSGQAAIEADPLPQFFEGIGLAYRRLHAVIDRPGFALNPTDCREMRVTSNVYSTGGAVAHPAARFQVGGCRTLRFKPRLSFELRGGTKRGDYPALTSTLRARRGDANLERASVALPRSAFLAQEHIRTICTRTQFAADRCPGGSVYGTAEALTPLLDKPLRGPVYLRSSENPLPDLVVALGGQIELELVGRIDSHRGGIRVVFASIPDAPVSKFVLRMKGGKRSLIVNSVDLCASPGRASVRIRAQNGRVRGFREEMGAHGEGTCGSARP